MSAASTDDKLQSLPHEVIAALNDGEKPPALVVPSEIDVCEIIQEMMRPWDARAASQIYLNPPVIDLRQQRLSPIEVEACPVCEAHYGRPTFAIRGLRHRVLTCVECGLGRLHPLPTIPDLAAFYPADYYGSPGAKFEPVTELLIRWVAAWHVRRLSRALPPAARILDVGCGRGVLLGSLADRGFEVYGMDVSTTAVAGADRRAKISIAGCLTEVGYPSGFFDQVIVWHVLEHLRNPREVLQEIHRILKPGGQIIVAVPNFSSWQARWAGAAWFHLDLPRHLYHFPVRGLRCLLKRTGFHLVSEQHFSLRQNPFGWVQSVMNTMPALPRNALYNLLRHPGATERGELSRWMGLCLKALYLAGMPVAIGLSLLEAAFRSGASVCIVGQAK